MVIKVKDPVTSLPPKLGGATETPAAPISPKTVAPENDPALSDSYQKMAQGLLGYKSSPLGSGAYKIFSDGIIFPPNLLDPHDSKTDIKYLRLLAAVLGMDEAERYFTTSLDERSKRGKKVKKVSKEEKDSSEEESSDSDNPEEKE